MLQIERVTAIQAGEQIEELIELLRDGVDGGASIGFLPPLQTGEAKKYWRGVFEDLEEESRILLIARQDKALVGSVQLGLVMKPNGSHRAEVQKLMVHSSARRNGLGRALMNAIEDEARAANRSLLVLDTRCGDPSEALYRKMGYTVLGVMPRYARSANGELDDCIFFYRFI